MFNRPRAEFGSLTPLGMGSESLELCKTNIVIVHVVVLIFYGIVVRHHAKHVNLSRLQNLMPWMLWNSGLTVTLQM
jgi:hypothetical protein